MRADLALGFAVEAMDLGARASAPCGETVIGLGLLVAGFVLVLLAGNALDDDRAPQSKSGALDALLFALCLVSLLAKRARDAEDDDF